MTDNSELENLAAILAGGNLELLPSLAYGYELVKPGSQKVLITMLLLLRAPTGQTFSIHARRRAGPFELVIVHAPWKPRGSAEGFWPIIVGYHESRLQIVGYVLPFNDIVPVLTAEDFGYCRSLGSLWVRWHEAFKKRRSRETPGSS